VSPLDTPRGLDVSEWQNLPDWASIPVDRAFSYVRVFEWRTGKTDGQAARNVAEASRTGRLVGGYHRADPTLRTPVEEARRFLGLLATFGLLAPGRLRPAIDIEPTNTVRDSSVDWPRWTREFFTAYRDLCSLPLLVYSSGSYFTSWLGGVADWPEWVRTWVGHSEKYSSPKGLPAEEWAGRTPYTPGRTAVHQYSTTGQLSGITTAVDLDCLMPGVTFGDLVLRAA
jgi:GH25 family lysozyme M1 (1,4-beta-N-acetylmuramidase)